MKKTIITALMLGAALGAWAQKETGGERLRDRYRQATDLY